MDMHGKAKPSPEPFFAWDEDAGRDGDGDDACRGQSPEGYCSGESLGDARGACGLWGPEFPRGGEGWGGFCDLWDWGGGWGDGWVTMAVLEMGIYDHFLHNP